MLSPAPTFADSLKNDQLLEGKLRFGLNSPSLLAAADEENFFQLGAEIVSADKSGSDQDGQVQELTLEDSFEFDKVVGDLSEIETHLAYTEDREYVHDGNPFNLDLPATRNPFEFSHQKHCDVFRHLKVPATPRRLDSYMRPEHIKRPLYGSPSKDQLFLLLQERLFSRRVLIFMGVLRLTGVLIFKAIPLRTHRPKVFNRLGRAGRLKLFLF